MMNDRFVVICHECSSEHYVSQVKFLNIEEDFQGRDVMHFECPVTKTPEKSLVYGSSYTQENMDYWS